jgi:hypothetical protein
VTKTRLYGPFRDHHPVVTVRMRPTYDLRDPRQAHRYKRRRECQLRLPGLLRGERM